MIKLTKKQLLAIAVGIIFFLVLVFTFYIGIIYGQLTMAEYINEALNSTIKINP